MKDPFKYVVLTRPLASEQRAFMNCGCTPCGQDQTSGCSSTSNCPTGSPTYLDAACCGYGFEAQGLYMAALEERLASIEQIFEETALGQELKLECEEARCQKALEATDQQLKEVQKKRADLKSTRKKK